MSNIVLWFDANEVKAALVEELPSIFFFQNRPFDLVNRYFADFDFLRNTEKKVIGLAFIADKDDELLQSRMVKESRNVKLDGNMLMFFLQEAVSFEIECVQGIGTRLYGDNQQNFILGIPDCDKNEIGFNLPTENVLLGS